MRRASLIALALSAGATLALALAHESLDPPLVAIHAWESWEGREIQVDALVVRSSPVTSGAQVLTLRDADAQGLAFLTERAPPLEGAELRLQGVVERYRGQMELRATRALVLRPSSTPLDAARLAALAPALVGQEVAARGVLRWPAEGALLAGQGGGVPLDLAEPWQAQELVGRDAVAMGVVRYDPAYARYVLETREVRAA